MTKLKEFAKENALLTLDISYRAKVGHVGSALSISDLVSVLYADRLNISPNNLNASNRDRFILSKGHAAVALYAALFQKEILSEKQLDTFVRDEGGLCEHPEIKDPGIEMTSGSLGHGLAFGAGIAWGLKLGRLSQDDKNFLDPQLVCEKELSHHRQKTRSLEMPFDNTQDKRSAKILSTHKPDPHVFVLISDGECGEGSTWEAALFASRMMLDNLTVIIDNNGWQCFGQTERITHLRPLAAKWRAFGFAVRKIDGHNISEIQKAYQEVPFSESKPSVIIANTVSGHGVSQIEDQLEGHYKVFNEDEYTKARSEIEERYNT